MKNWFKDYPSHYAIVLDPETNKISREHPKFRVKPIRRWFDMWMGLFIDQKNRIIYFFPIPCFGFKIGYQYKYKDKRSSK